jgi:hypothetical protein
VKNIVKGKVLSVGAALLLAVAGCTSSSTEDTPTSSPVPSVGTAGSRSLDVAFGEWAAFSDGVAVMVVAPQEFTPSEDVYAQSIWGPVELDEWDHYVRTTVWNSQDPLQDGQQMTYDVGFGIDVGEGIEVPDGVRISVQMGDGWNGEPTETFVFGP